MRIGLSVLAWALTLTVGNCGATRADAPPAATVGAFGIDLAGMDPAVRPGNDFYLYAGGGWLKTHELPPDRTSYGTSAQLRDKAQDQVRAILDEAAASGAPPGSIERKIGDYYAAHLDTATINARGLAPAAPALGAIAAARTYEDLARLMTRADLELPAPLNLGISLDLKNPDRYVVSVSAGGIALPDRDFYLRDDAQFATIRTQYRDHIARVLALTDPTHAADGAARILALETEIAKLHWPRADQRDRDRIYNPRTRAELVALAPEFPWTASFEAADLAGVKDVIVAELSAVAPLAQLYRATPIQTWQQYLTYHYLRRHASLLPASVDDEVFAFFAHTLSGQPEQRPRWKRAVDATNAALGEGVGQVYVARHFPPSSKAAVLALVENLRRAYGERISHSPWMSAPTRRVALEKLAAFRPKLGYPDHWRDYSALQVRRDDAFGNSVRVAEFDWHRQVARLDQATDRDEWYMPPQVVNAYYNPVYNEIVFPAAILQPPFFDPAADPAVNYGAIGAVIGHEMGHGFDDQGSKSDARGVMRNWWQAADITAFKALGDRLVAQYGAYEPVPGIKLNGRLTLGENIGDLGGVSVALEAYRLSLHGARAKPLAGFSGEQRFFLSWAQIYRTLYREQSLRNQVMSDPHSPSMYRVNGVLRNVDAWYDAFKVQPGDALYLPAAERVHIW